MRHDETPLQVFTAHPSGVPVPIVRGLRRREPTIPFRSADLSSSEPAPAEPAPAEPAPAEPAPAEQEGTLSDRQRALAEAPTWIFETQATAAAAVAAPVALPGVGAAAPSAFDAAPSRYWRDMDAAYDRPLGRIWRALLRLLGIERS